MKTTPASQHQPILPTAHHTTHQHPSHRRDSSYISLTYSSSDYFIASTMTVIPGCESHPFSSDNETGVEHSKRKVKQIAIEIFSSFPKSYFTPELDDESDNMCIPYDIFSQDSSIKLSPCEMEEETMGYRCSCSFQFVEEEEERVSREIDMGNTTTMLRYAIRSNREAIILNGNPFFSIALPRIQLMMDLFSELINSTKGQEKYQHVRKHLASITFQSSWDGVSDSYITLNYYQPIDLVIGVQEWKKEALFLCNSIPGLTAIIGRSKKKCYVIESSPKRQEISSSSTAIGEQLECTSISSNFESLIIRDTIYPLNGSIGPIHYHKPLSAFHHPNGIVMLKALDWILSKMTEITSFLTTTQHKKKETLRLLELYCGAGAHTMPISKLGCFTHITAVELDERLTKACERNWSMNNDNDDNNNNDTGTKLDIISGDASQIANIGLLKKKKKKMTMMSGCQAMVEQDQPKREEEKSWWELTYDVLLVDPPRQGLSSKVCDLAIELEEIHDMIYISCGHAALNRDLGILLKKTFYIKECVILGEPNFVS